MKQEWQSTVIKTISVAVCVTPGSGKSVHKDRPFHGFVLNDAISVKDYIFSDGRVMHTGEKSLFYLPKNSSYYVKDYSIGVCYAINFDADICDAPFVLDNIDYENLKKSFKVACSEWKASAPTCHAASMRALYDCIYQCSSAQQKQVYMPNALLETIAPAIEELERNFTSNELTVSQLAKLCGMSEVYFRKIFINHFGISPKEYMIRKRMECAKQLLVAGELEISGIATYCGYSDPCHFSREFKKRYGVSPKNFQ